MDPADFKIIIQYMSFLFEPENLLPKDGIAIYHGVVFNEQEANEICKDLFETIPWTQDEVVMFGKKIMTKRKVAWYADTGINYTYAGVKKSGLQWTEPLLVIKQKIEDITGATYNACLLNLYHDGQEGMGWHSDGEKELLKHGAIASLSLGAARRFLFKHKLTKEIVGMTLHPGSLLVMKGVTQSNWLHRLPPAKSVLNPRINLTFRTAL
jgi:alkylated DNA repair dioxygenase AlkB